MHMTNGRYLALATLVLALAGCQSPPADRPLTSEVPEPPGFAPPPETCQAGAARFGLGLRVSPLLIEEMRQRAGARMARTVLPRGSTSRWRPQAAWWVHIAVRREEKALFCMHMCCAHTAAVTNPRSKAPNGQNWENNSSRLSGATVFCRSSNPPSLCRRITTVQHACRQMKCCVP